MKASTLLTALRIAQALIGLIERSLRDDRPITDGDLAEAFRLADAAEDNWAQANAEAGHE